MAQWFYYDRNGNAQGPVADGQLKQLADSGVVTRETVLRLEDGRRVHAGTVNGLFPQAAPQPMSHPEPTPPPPPPMPTTPQNNENFNRPETVPPHPVTAVNPSHARSVTEKKTEPKTFTEYPANFLKILAFALSVCSLLGAAVVLIVGFKMAESSPDLTKMYVMIGSCISAVSWFVLFAAPAEIIKLLIHANQMTFQILKDEVQTRKNAK